MLRGKNNKGQVGDTITWFVATIAIIVILLFFIFGASMLGSTKSIGKYRESLTSGASYEGDELFLKKSIFTYLDLSASDVKKVLDDYFELADTEEKFKIPAKETMFKIRRNLANE